MPLEPKLAPCGCLCPDRPRRLMGPFCKFGNVVEHLGGFQAVSRLPKGSARGGFCACELPGVWSKGVARGFGPRGLPGVLVQGVCQGFGPRGLPGVLVQGVCQGFRSKGFARGLVQVELSGYISSSSALQAR